MHDTSTNVPAKQCPDMRFETPTDLQPVSLALNRVLDRLTSENPSNPEVKP